MSHPPIKHINYTISPEVGHINNQELIKKIIENIRTKQAIYLVLDESSSLSPAPNFFPWQIYVMLDGVANDAQMHASINGSMIYMDSIHWYTQQQLIDLLGNPISKQAAKNMTYVKKENRKPINIHYNKRDDKLSLWWWEYKEVNPRVKY